MADEATTATRPILEAMQADLEGGRFFSGDAQWPAKGGSWAWLQDFAQRAQWVVRERQPRTMRVLITWEYPDEPPAEGVALAEQS